MERRAIPAASFTAHPGYADSAFDADTIPIIFTVGNA
jgi:hypothetical protein